MQETRLEDQFSRSRQPQDHRGDLYRNVVLPAGNLQVAIEQYIHENGRSLDPSTLTLLSATKEVLGEISRSASAIAADQRIAARDCLKTWRNPLFTEG